jgi:hypothetical protein
MLLLMFNVLVYGRKAFKGYELLFHRHPTGPASAGWPAAGALTVCTFHGHMLCVFVLPVFQIHLPPTKTTPRVSRVAL